jgi:hypothetical protein
VFNRRDKFQDRLARFLLQHWFQGKLVQQERFNFSQPTYTFNITQGAAGSSGDGWPGVRGLAATLSRLLRAVALSCPARRPPPQEEQPCRRLLQQTPSQGHPDVRGPA